MTADPKPARGEAKAERRRKRRDAKDATYLAWLHTQPCLCCGASGVEVHHERTLGKGDAYGVPLCTFHHRGHSGRHGLRSRMLFEERYKLNLRVEIARLKGAYETEHAVVL